MSRYTLVATMDDMANGAFINAQDDEDASMQAIEIILDKATDSNLWSRGLIELRDIEGRLIRSMDPKPVDLPVFSKMFSKMSGL